MTRWTTTSDAGTTRLHRPHRGRLDFHGQTTLPHTKPKRLAHQIRQDLWRALQSLKGFSPVIEITGDQIKAGGQVDGPIPPTAATTAAEVLNNPKNRARWLRHAGLALLLATPIQADAEALHCTPDHPYFCANLHISCAGRSTLPTAPLTLHLTQTSAQITGQPAPLTLTKDRTARILRSDKPGYIRILNDNRFVQRIYRESQALMAIGRCETLQKKESTG